MEEEEEDSTVEDVGDGPDPGPDPGQGLAPGPDRRNDTGVIVPHLRDVGRPATGTSRVRPGSAIRVAAEVIWRGTAETSATDRDRSKHQQRQRKKERKRERKKRKIFFIFRSSQRTIYLFPSKK